MLEIAQSLEQTAANFRPAILVGLGLACAIIGLFVWLGGLGLRKPLVAIVGAIAGGACGLLIAGGNIGPAMISAVVGAIITIIFEKIFITIIAAALAGTCGFAVLTTLYKADFSDGLRQACSAMPLFSWVIIAAIVVAFVVAGLYLWRFISALCCAAFGTILVFAGMILLLLYKGAAPASSICSRTLLYTAVFTAMTLFGTFEQLLLCRPLRKPPITRKDPDKDKQAADQPRTNWRTQ